MAEDVPDKEIEDRKWWYGWGCLKPRFLQGLNRLAFYMPLAIILHVVFGFVSGWVGTALQEIEKQFGLPSTVSATLGTASDLGMTCSVIFVGYIGTKFNKARGMAVGLFVFGLGLLLNALPHYFLDPYKPPAYGPNATSASPICPVNSSSAETGSESGNHMAYFSLLLVGQVMAGLGSTPVYTLGISYLDDNADVATAAILIGVVSTVTTVGAALSALVGGPIIEHVYVDFDRVDTKSLPFTRGDPHWVGAWWVGFIICGFICMIIAIPISGFPKLLPSSPLRKNKEKPKTDVPKNVCTFLQKTITDFFKALFKLIFDLEFVFINISNSIEGVAIAGMSMFVFKFVNHEYDMDYDVGGIVIGTKAIVGSGGYILAGYLVKWFKLDLLGMEKMSAILYLLSILFGLSLFAGCPNINMPGVERPYPGDSAVSGLVSQCQGQCLCDGQGYNPVCGADGLVYFSPCHAGCHNVTMDGDMKTFTNCSCVAVSQNVSISDVMATATSGKCDVDCWAMYFVMPCLFVVYIIIISCGTLSILTVLRCVDQELKPFALAIKMIFVRVLGTIPAPLVIGKIVDSACTVWSGKEGDDGRFCEMYDKYWLTTGIAIMWLASGLISFVFMLFAIIVNKWKKMKDEKKGDKANDDSDNVKDVSNGTMDKKMVPM